MSLIPTVGRRSLKLRSIIIGLYVVLGIGSITMLYPFSLMLSASVCSICDLARYRLVPEFLYNDNALMVKYVVDKHSDGEMLEITYGDAYYGIIGFLNDRRQPPPDFGLPPENALPALASQVADWNAFKIQLGPKYKTSYYVSGWSFTDFTALLNGYRAFLRETFHDDVDALNTVYGVSLRSFDDAQPPVREPAPHFWLPPEGRRWSDWEVFLQSLPADSQQVMSSQAAYSGFLFSEFLSVDRYNEALDASITHFGEVRLPTHLPGNPKEAALWTKFIRVRCPLYTVVLDPGAGPAYRSFLAETYGSAEAINETYGTEFSDIGSIELLCVQPAHRRQAVDWERFIAQEVDPAHVSLVVPEDLFRQFLEKKYGTINACNAAYGTAWGSFDEVDPPRKQADIYYLMTHKNQIRWDFITRNYRTVLKYMGRDSRAFLNTGVLVCLFLVLQLTVNPMAAYCLSRFRLPYTQQILVLLVGTMAFPAAVGMIPNFLLLKELGLMNTYWAIALPAAANGYFIFVLKGFFDSLPNELFEHAEMEGAGQFWMFRHVAVPLSKPVLALLALSAFAAAYGSFMWALVVCQDKRMWTVMVNLQQLMVGAPQEITMAGMALASIPTLIVFLFCQRMIIRGIIVPSYK